MMVYKGGRSKPPLISASSQAECESLASHSRCITQGERVTGYPETWVSSTDGLDELDSSYICYPCRNWAANPRISNPWASDCSDWANPFPLLF
jgi:hypothetical protein